MADCIGVRAYRDGACPTYGNCGCPAGGVPVCANNGKSYDNECVARCAGTTVAYSGSKCATESGCINMQCPALIQPVCGADGVTYPNYCFALCRQLSWGLGPCVKPPPPTPPPALSPPPTPPPPPPGDCNSCGTEYVPVCGEDGVTYFSLCLATCLGKRVARAGPCGAAGAAPPPPPLPRPPRRPPPAVVRASPPPRRSPPPRKLPPPPRRPRPPHPPPACQCKKNSFKPVCGTNHISYPNKCLARCAGTAVKYEGNCANPAACLGIACPAIEQPVCGADGTTYGNSCWAACTGVTIVRKGPCTPQICGCTAEPVYVCTAKGKGRRAVYTTYLNRCAARCAKAEVAYVGRCADPSGCIGITCPALVAPVCGFDDKEYQNSCLASCTGVSFTAGACRKRG
ncbi:hypothetical protein HYH03_013702 [Edaphochlamys debaryana]|uniref:Kazal-like domain-containing protein n=1 Tax=Edaphochlamys debaryana TaxID=47281 RepID=A0A835XRN2_9CHLO|nr:hypothetical protein HYH03_013702 [Edaphochlamys debaryana]|eukprot:KAG2487703.1 hypothetical protein HYH03_013702 [Edaphochlamys debaryana]